MSVIHYTQVIILFNDTYRLFYIGVKFFGKEIMCKFLTFLMLLVFSVFTLSNAEKSPESLVSDDGWVKTRTKKGFSVFKRKDAKTDILPIKVEGVLNASIDHIMENLRNIETQKNWTPDLLEKTTLKDLGPKAALTYSLSDMPWPVYDRTLILHNELKLDKKRKLLFVLSKTVPYENPPRPKRTIEAFVGYSNMGFRPVSKDQTYVELTAFIDPKGSIPSFLINFYQSSWPIEFLAALESVSQKQQVELRPGLKIMLKGLLEEMGWKGDEFDRPSESKQ